MTAKEETALRALYQQWPLARLARASTAEKHEYTPEALALMADELKKRNVSADEITAAAVSVPPPRLERHLPERDNWLFPARLDRRKYLVRSLVWLVTGIAATVACEFVPALEPGSYVVSMLAVFLYGALGLFIPRSRDAGISKNLAILFVLIPLSAMIVSAYLFFAPTKEL